MYEISPTQHVVNKNTTTNTIPMIPTRSLEPGTLCLEVEPPPGWERGTARCVLRSRIICRSWRSQTRPQHCTTHQSPDSFEKQKKHVSKKNQEFCYFHLLVSIFFDIFYGWKKILSNQRETGDGLFVRFKIITISAPTNLSAGMR